eukprot:gnl/MRDRNA2_/MRDRNA2_62670_c0_seq1.p1 gnl/MRDRNA2_/MRDRNA2_62670_c0~~gnl/MRDRNA2_/MRDRNA2_62670_c0_seq1.p1  ORF type:complete len:204 (-),score=55.59 gnl/MRDRNA2_/MRDRNA2_62670_c0_seq1:51-662(-)
MPVGAVGAIVGARRARCAPTSRVHASGARLKEFDKELAEIRELNKVMRKYDTNKSGKLEQDQVKVLLTDLDFSTPPGTPPSDDELKYIMKVADQKCDNGAIDLSELKAAMVAWKSYINLRSKMEEAILKFDQSGTGKLEKTELKEYLKHLNDGMPVADDEVDWVLSQADVFGDGACSQTELAMATAAWYAHVEEKKNSCCNIL